MPDFYKAARQNMLLKAAVEFINAHRHFLLLLFRATGMVVFVLKGDSVVFFINGPDAMRCNGYFMGISAQVFQGRQKPFERYADDIVVHCKTEKQALFVLKMIQQRMTACKLTLHPVKTKIVNLRGKSEKKYPRSFDFLGFTIRPLWSKASKGNKLMVSGFMSTKSKTSVLAKFKSFHIHKWRKPIEDIALKLKPVIQPRLFPHWQLVHP